MDLLPQGKRIWSLDLLRGFFILLIILAHSIFFFHNHTNSYLSSINFAIDTIAFTGLLFISGATGYLAYIHHRHPTTHVIKNVSKRLLIYLAGYYALSIFGLIVQKDFSLTSAIDVLLFFRLVPFTEFILAFIIFGFLKIPLRSLYQRIAKSWLLTVSIGIGLFLLGTYLAGLNLGFLPTGWKAILVGHPGWYSFPVLQYAIVYLLGMAIGYHFWHHDTKRQMYKELGLISLASLAVIASTVVVATFAGLDLMPLFQRFTPSLPFIMIGLGTAAFALFLLLHHHHLRRITWWRSFLLLCGQNAYALFFTHTFLVFLYAFSGLPPVNSTLLVLVLWLASLAGSIYLARILPLNYRFTLDFASWCECHLHECEHDSDHHVKQLGHTLSAFTHISDIFSLPIGRRKLRLIHPKAFIVGITILLFVVAPLGFAEDTQIIQQAIEASSGQVNRTWSLTNFAHQPLTYTITLPQDIMTQRNFQVFYQIDDQDYTPMQGEGASWSATIDISQQSLGKHQIKTIVALGLDEFITQSSEFNVSDPVYVTWTIDWEGYDVDDRYLDAMITIAETYDIPMTHLFNPRIYFTPEIAPERAEYLTDWVKNRRDLYQEEIGLHLHMFPDYITETGLEPKTEPAWGGGFTPGYDILTTAYDQQEMAQILTHAKQVFFDKGLGQPRSYRAGAWFANTETLAALEQTEFLVDSSARTQYDFGTNDIPGFWDVDLTTQPYNPSTTDQNSSSPPPQFNLLEIPNNGADTFAYSSGEMIDRFNQNYTGGISHRLRQVTFLSHPHWLNANRQQTLRDVFTHVNQYRFDQDKGPVVPTTLLGVYRAWSERE